MSEDKLSIISVEIVERYTKGHREYQLMMSLCSRVYQSFGKRYEDKQEAVRKLEEIKYLLDNISHDRGRGILRQIKTFEFSSFRVQSMKMC